MTGRVRIIAGALKGRRIEVADVPGLRPTPDRVRETLFNWLGARIEGARCLDLFAGSGALGFEAVSRGAREVVMVEANASAADLLATEASRIGAREVTVARGDATRWMERATAVFDVAFLDPPFAGPVSAISTLARLEALGRLASGAVAYLEGAQELDAGVLPLGWELLRRGKAGKVRYHLAVRTR